MAGVLTCYNLSSGSGCWKNKFFYSEKNLFLNAFIMKLVLIEISDIYCRAAVFETVKPDLVF